MRFSTCNDYLDELLFSKPKKIIIYGEAATGKTNILLNTIKCSYKSLAQHEALFFISTEGSSFATRMHLLDIDSRNIFFSIAIDQQHILSNVLEILKNLVSLRPVCIIIDSINYHYRIESLTPIGIKFFAELLSLLDILNENGVFIISSAQVRASEDDTFPGYVYLHYWADIIIELERISKSRRVLRILKPKIDRIFQFNVLVDGIIWLK
ncbi:MAG: hypothetical protein QW101_02140 [Ignisphaera sp.]|uniref:AAA family ATPase n=1 Tax=Ignisphaera aggregans TaxID=334771 RepID=A0A7J3MYS4_9CREN